VPACQSAPTKMARAASPPGHERNHVSLIIGDSQALAPAFLWSL
jgi:hypothetical protein